MKVILLERVGRTGSIGDEVSVKDGFARNFLLPQGKALRATEANRKKFEAERAHIHRALESTGWNKKEAARILEISRGTLYRKILEYALEPQVKSAKPAHFNQGL